MILWKFYQQLSKIADSLSYFPARFKVTGGTETTELAGDGAGPGKFMSAQQGKLMLGDKHTSDDGNQFVA